MVVQVAGSVTLRDWISGLPKGRATARRYAARNTTPLPKGRSGPSAQKKAPRSGSCPLTPTDLRGRGTADSGAVRAPVTAINAGVRAQAVDDLSEAEARDRGQGCRVVGADRRPHGRTATATELCRSGRACTSCALKTLAPGKPRPRREQPGRSARLHRPRDRRRTGGEHGDHKVVRPTRIRAPRIAARPPRTRNKTYFCRRTVS